MACLSRSASLAQAARTLEVTPPSLSVRLKALETRAGTTLVLRTTRRLSLTDAGAQLAATAVDLLERLDNAEMALRGGQSGFSGSLRIVAPFGFGREFVAPAMAGFGRLHPALRCELVLSERPTRDQEGAADVVVHVGELRDSSAVAYPLARNARWLCASPAYLREHAAPHAPSDLARHRILGLRENDEDATLWHLERDGTTETVRLKAAMVTNDGETLVRWAVAGHGIAMRSAWHVERLVSAEALVRLLPSWQLPSADAVALVPTRRNAAASVLGFVQHLKRQIAAHPSSIHWTDRESAAAAG
ncbi:hypothetical protein ASC87_25860 [Rhizobacter sp. Root1221]|nr:hypothetical protein ASC87_25860 [Rhizobacter sp. Root1221]